MTADEPTTASRLSRESAVLAALRIIDEHGAEALSMRAVAREVGSPVMSLYRHVASREDLEDGVVGLLVAGVGPLPDDTSWDGLLRAWGAGYREMVRAHPNAVSLLSARPLAGYRAQRELAERALGLLQRAGASPEAARLHLRAALVVIAGFCHVEAQSGRVPPPASAQQLEAEGFPLLAGLAGRLGRDGEEMFTLVMDMVVGGIAARL